MRLSLAGVALAVWLQCASATSDAHLPHIFGAQGVNFWRLQAAAQEKANTAARSRHGHPLFVQDRDALKLVDASAPKFAEQWFEQPLDHFTKTSETFPQRYWINTRHYNASVGGPVIVLDGGETSGEDRLPFLDTGIVDILAKATGGVGVVLEHRYYGSSVPVANLSTDSLRWLNNAQSAADSARFMANVRFDGIDEDLTAPGNPWIYYGGSYAGARAAHMRILYPDLVFGAIASSGVTHASIINWEYMDVIRLAADPECSENLESAVSAIDRTLKSRLPYAKSALKALFGLSGVEHDDDFASTLSFPLGSWQSKNWDDAVGSDAWDRFCHVLNRPLLGYPGEDGEGEVDADIGEYGLTEDGNVVARFADVAVPLSVINYARFIKTMVKEYCPEDQSHEDCFGTYDDEKFRDTSLSQTWRKWLFQVCTEWGYFTTAPPDPSVPTIISRLITLEHELKICRQAFPPGRHFRVPLVPNVTVVNELGDFEIAADRLAIIDGDVDPWKPSTPHSRYAPDRKDTLLRPFKLIPGGVHHYDENGLRNHSAEPLHIQKIHNDMIEFVLEWLKDWKADGKQ